MKLSSIGKSASQAVFGKIQLTLLATRQTPNNASRLVQCLSASLVKTRHARPGIVEMRRYNSTTMLIPLRPAMHGHLVHSPPPPLSQSWSRSGNAHVQRIYNVVLPVNLSTRRSDCFKGAREETFTDVQQACSNVIAGVAKLRKHSNRERPQG